MPPWPGSLDFLPCLNLGNPEIFRLPGSIDSGLKVFWFLQPVGFPTRLSQGGLGCLPVQGLAHSHMGHVDLGSRVFWTLCDPLSLPTHFKPRPT